MKPCFSWIPILFLSILVALGGWLPGAPAWAQPTDEMENPAQDPDRPVRDKWALVVGISKFQNADIPQLKYAAKDAADFRNYLVNEGHFAADHVRVLLDQDATRKNVLSELGTKFLARVAKPDDLVVLFISTHGSPANADIRGKNFVVAYDSEPDDLFTTGIEMTNIVDSIHSRVLCERVLLLLDACHSGAVQENAKAIFRGSGNNFDADTIAQGSGQMVICSSAPDQISWESKRYKNGIFTQRLLEALRSRGDRTTLKDAFPRLKDQVSAEVQEDYASKQTPVLSSKWKGSDLMLAAVPTNPQQLPTEVQRLLGPDSVAAKPTGSDAPAGGSKPASVAVALPSTNPASSKDMRAAVGMEDWHHAIKLYNRGDYASAVDLLSAAVKGAAKSQFDAHYYLANSLMKLNKIDQAVREYKEAFHINSNGKEADYCLQMITAYGRDAKGRPVSSVAAPISRAFAPNAMVLRNQDQSVGTSHSGVDSKLLEQVRAKMPRIKVTPVRTPVLADVLGWTLQDRANYIAEANSRVAEARTNLDEATQLFARAKSMASSVVPNARDYGETEEHFRQRQMLAQSAAGQLLSPYQAELDLKNRQVQDQLAILDASQSAYNQLYNSGYTYTPTRNYAPNSCHH